jgi:hypothetical protein
MGVRLATMGRTNMAYELMKTVSQGICKRIENNTLVPSGISYLNSPWQEQMQSVLRSTWQQPIWYGSDSNSHGTVSVSNAYLLDPAWESLDDGYYQDDGWSVEAKTGWLTIELNYYISIDSIEFYNVMSAGSNRTKDAKFTGAVGVALGSPFTAINEDWGRTFIWVGGVVTNKITLTISSSYGSWIGAGNITFMRQLALTKAAVRGTSHCGAAIQTATARFRPTPRAAKIIHGVRLTAT